jgi:hypothetical protein
MPQRQGQDMIVTRKEKKEKQITDLSRSDKHSRIPQYRG